MHVEVRDHSPADELLGHEIAGERDATATGVWVGPEPLRTICALGVRASACVCQTGTVRF